MIKNFSGSYDPADVIFLLDPVTVAKGEEGGSDFAKAVEAHTPPGAEYAQLFLAAVERNQDLVARDVVRLARHLASRSQCVTLVSLVCAGTPVGVLIERALTKLGNRSTHYSISTVRGRGVDFNALDYIRARHADESIVFLDGWTGKGFIAQELLQSVTSYNQSRDCNLDAEMVVLSDLAGVAGFAASSEDYLVPSSMLRSTVNGLITNSTAGTEPDCFDACLYLQALETQDCSRSFVDALEAAVDRELLRTTSEGAAENPHHKRWLNERTERFVEQSIERYQLQSRNWVKPGICEATRALLTRAVPMLLLVREEDAGIADVEHLKLLASTRGHEIVLDATLPLRAAVLLRA